MPTRKPLSAGAWIAIFFGAALLGICCLTGGVLVIKYARKADASSPATETKPSKPTKDADGYYYPHELKKYFSGRSEADALKFFGNPIDLRAKGPLTIYFFSCRVRNPATGHTDTMILVAVNKGEINDVDCGDADR